MPLPPPVNLRPSDLKDATPSETRLIEFLGRQLQPFLQQMRSLVDGRLGTDNLNAAFVDVEVLMPATPTPGLPPFPMSVNTGLSGVCRGLTVVRVQNNSSSGYQEAAVFPDWQDNGNGTVTLKWLTGLSASTAYTVTLRAEGE